MTDLSHISTEELLFDRQECFNDLVALSHAKLDDPYYYGASGIQMRIDSNLKMIEIIRLECEKRGFDPARLDQVKGARR